MENFSHEIAPHGVHMVLNAVTWWVYDDDILIKRMWKIFLMRLPYMVCTCCGRCMMVIF